ncbi:MAG: aldose 1-epimerase family protein [Planctomycetaceae bacterium]|nr:aldose 1-epimerase family protein [Planctomycetaceae bacterium]
MPRKTWTLTDVDADVYLDRLAVGPGDVGGPAVGYSVTKRTLRGGLRDGVDVVEVDNGRFRFTVVPTRGMNIWRANCDGVELGWKSPVRGPVNPAFVPLWEPSGIGWLRGFDELLVRCGLESNGAPEFLPNGALRYPLHGRIGNTPAHKVELTIDGDTGEIALTGVVDESRLFGPKFRLSTTIATKVGESRVTIADQITNLSAEPSQLELFYHTNLGWPLVGAGATVALPVERMAPRDAVAAGAVPNWGVYDPETPGLGEAVFFFEPASDAAGRTLAVVTSADGNRGFGLRFNKRQMPCFTLWKNCQAVADGYVTGLEPGINFPNVRSFEERQGRVADLKPGETRCFELTLEGYANADATAAARREVAAIQANVTPGICVSPDPRWSP